MNYTTRDPRPVNRDPVRAIPNPALPRDHIIESFVGLIKTAEQKDWWGTIGIELVVQDGRIETIKKRTEQTEKGTL